MALMIRSVRFPARSVNVSHDSLSPRYSRRDPETIPSTWPVVELVMNHLETRSTPRMKGTVWNLGRLTEAMQSEFPRASNQQRHM
jgi:hypothetical protein